MIGFCYFCKKIVFCFGVWPMLTPFLHKFGPKMAIFRGFTKFFSELLDCQLKLLILIESPVTYFHWKPAKKTVCDLGEKLGPKIKFNVMKKVKTGIINRFVSYVSCGI